MRTELPKSLYLPGDLCRLVLASSIFQGGLEARPWRVFRSGWSKGKGVGGPKRVGAYGSELPGASDSRQWMDPGLGVSTAVLWLSNHLAVKCGMKNYTESLHEAHLLW